MTYFKEELRKVKLKLNFIKYKINRERFLIKKCRSRLGYEIDLENPKTYNEKLQWLKLYWYDDRATQCVDKFEVREFITSKGYGHLLTELYGVYDSFSQIDFSAFPEEYVLKVTHNSGGVVVVNKKNPLNLEKAKNILNKSLKRNYYIQSQEWVYKDITPRIICEEFIKSEDGEQSKDYKFFCFNGQVKFLFVASNRGYSNGKATTKFNFYTPKWEKINVENGYEPSPNDINKPDNLNDMIKIAEELSTDFPHVRVDLYSEFDRIYFGELTFFHFSGTTKFKPKEYDEYFGRYLDLSKITKTVYADEQ